MRLRVPVALVVALVALVQLVPGGRATITTPYAPSSSDAVAPGVRYEWGSLRVNGAARDVNIVEIDPTESQIEIRLSQGGSSAVNRATVVDQAASYSQDGRRVVATVNGSLFNYMPLDTVPLGGTGLGLNISDGELINAGDPGLRPGLPAFGLDAAQAMMIGTPQQVMTLTLPGGEAVALDRINQRRPAGDVALYTPRFGPQTWTDDLGTEFIIDGFDLPLAVTGTHSGTVVDVRLGVGNTTIGPGQVVLSVSNTADPWLTELPIGSEVSLALVVDEAWQSVTHAVGGRDLLVVDGQSVVPLPDTDGSHARTAVGIDTNGRLLLVTADAGTYVKGLKLTELAELMISIGAVDALNLDGGGSSQMAVRLPGDFEVSSVSTDAISVDRPVVNALQIVSHAPDGPLDRLVLSPADVTVATGQAIDFTAKGQDAALNGVELDPSALQWNVEPVEGEGGAPSFEVQGSVLSVVGDVQGDYVVTVRSGAFEATALLEVGPDTVAPVVSAPEVALVDSGAVGLNSATVGVAWAALDNVSATSVQVQRRINSGSWKDVAVSGPGAVSASHVAAFGRRIQFRVRATDAAGNTSAWIASKPYRVVLFNDNHNSVGTSGIWNRKRVRSAIGGQYLRSRTSGAAFSISVTGVQVAVIGNRGPTHGQADVYLNSSLASSISLDAVSTEVRRILYLSPKLSDLTMTAIQLVNSNPGTQQAVDVDAILVLVPG